MSLTAREKALAKKARWFSATSWGKKHVGL